MKKTYLIPTMMVVEIKTNGNMLNITSSGDGGLKGGSNGNYGNGDGITIGSRDYSFGDEE